MANGLSQYFSDEYGGTPPFVPRRRRRIAAGGIPIDEDFTQGMPVDTTRYRSTEEESASRFLTEPEVPPAAVPTETARPPLQPRKFPKMEALQAMGPEPTREQFPVSKKRMLAALVLGTGAGMGRGGSEAARETTSAVAEAPYRRVLSSYQARRKKAESEAAVERTGFEMESAGAREQRAATAEERAAAGETRAAATAKREEATPIRSIRKKMPDGTHIIDIYFDATTGQEREVDRGLEGAQPRTDVTTTTTDLYERAARGDKVAQDALVRMRKDELTKIAAQNANKVDAANARNAITAETNYLRQLNQIEMGEASKDRKKQINPNQAALMKQTIYQNYASQMQRLGIQPLPEPAGMMQSGEVDLGAAARARVAGAKPKLSDSQGLYPEER